MKTTIVYLTALASSIAIASGQPVATYYADIFPPTESRLGSLSSVRKVEDTAAASATYGGFATKIVFPEGTTSVTFTAASCGIESYANGIYTIHVPGGVNMALSKFNPEGDVDLPSIFARSSTNSMIVPFNSNLVGTPIQNAKTFLITEHKYGFFPKLVNVGDYWKLYRSLSGTYTIGTTTTEFSFPDKVATVIVVNETAVSVSGVSMDYPNNPKITSTVTSGGTTTLMATGLTVDSYNKTWWMETSTDLTGWTTTTNASVSPDVTITFPMISGENRRFWRINGLRP